MNLIISVLLYFILGLCIVLLLVMALLLHKIGTLVKWELEEQHKAANVASSKEEQHYDGSSLL